MPKSSYGGSPVLPGGSSSNLHTRRKFLAGTALVSIASVSLSSCQKIWDHIPKPGDNDSKKINLGKDDTGLLNYCYLLKQLESAFFSEMVRLSLQQFEDSEKLLISDIASHDIAHREFLKRVLLSQAIRKPEFDFSTIDFSKKQDSLLAARKFKNLVITAYNGIGSRFVNQDRLLYHVKMVAVEARHLGYLQTVYMPGGTSEYPMEFPSATPSQVMATAQLYIKEKIDYSGIAFES